MAGLFEAAERCEGRTRAWTWGWDAHQTSQIDIGERGNLFCGYWRLLGSKSRLTFFAVDVDFEKAGNFSVRALGDLSSELDRVD